MFSLFKSIIRVSIDDPAVKLGGRSWLLFRLPDNLLFQLLLYLLEVGSGNDLWVAVSTNIFI